MKSKTRPQSKIRNERFYEVERMGLKCSSPATGSVTRHQNTGLVWQEDSRSPESRGWFCALFFPALEEVECADGGWQLPLLEKEFTD